jgi:hypothetical protein
LCIHKNKIIHESHFCILCADNNLHLL